MGIVSSQGVRMRQNWWENWDKTCPGGTMTSDTCVDSTLNQKVSCAVPTLGEETSSDRTCKNGDVKLPVNGGVLRTLDFNFPRHSREPLALD
eukprot:4916193-Prymnesium_polylepis.1